MELLLVALVLFLGMIVCWIVLPSSPPTKAVHYEAEAANRGTARQPA